MLFTGTHILHRPTVARPWFAFPADVRIRLTLAYTVIFLIALLGNTLGLFVVLKKSSRSHRVTTLFIANMAVADLLLTVTVMPFQVAFLYRFNYWIGGMLGNITCKALFYVIPVSIAATVLTMMLISVDRFYAIFYPFKDKIFRKPKILSGTIWILSFVLMLPYPMSYQVKFNSSQNHYQCLQVWPLEDPNAATFKETRRVLKLFHIIVFATLYALPLSIIIVIYSLICCKMWHRIIPGNATERNRAAAEKSKRKVVRLLVVIVVVFALCWSPTYVNHYLGLARPDQAHNLPFEVGTFFYWLGHANSAINPCIYILMSDKFRRELASTLAGWCPCLRRFSCPPNCPNA